MRFSPLMHRQWCRRFHTRQEDHDRSDEERRRPAAERPCDGATGRTDPQGIAHRALPGTRDPHHTAHPGGPGPAAAARIVLRTSRRDASTRKDMGRTAAFGQAIGSSVASDEVVKGAMGPGIRTVRDRELHTLIAAAEAAGDPETARVCRSILKQEGEVAGGASAAGHPAVHDARRASRRRCQALIAFATDAAPALQYGRFRLHPTRPGRST